jgi:hypothetical protein
MAASGELEARRHADLVHWLRDLAEQSMLQRLRKRDGTQARLAAAAERVIGGAASAYRMAIELSGPADSDSESNRD